MNTKMEKVNSIKEERSIVSTLGNELREITQQKYLGNEYLTLCACALELIEEFLGEDYDFAIDIEKIAQKMGVQVIYQSLNGPTAEEVRQHRVVGRNLKRMNRITKEQISNILIDSESNRNEQRYALTHELAHYLVHYNESLYNNVYCVMPMLFKDMEEMVADVFATFLLIPVPIFLKEFMTYIGEQPVPVKTSEWLQYLSIVAEVPYEYMAIGYQNIRYVCGILYDHLKNREEHIEKNQPDMDEADRITKKWTDKMLACMTENVVEKLFC